MLLELKKTMGTREQRFPGVLARFRTRKQTVWTRLRLGWGKVRRFYLVHFRPRYVENAQKRRVGECVRCGACCMFMFECVFLKAEHGLPCCSIYFNRPGNCKVFPIDERDIIDVDLVMEGKPCGFSFLPPPPRASWSERMRRLLPHRGKPPLHGSSPHH